MVKTATFVGKYFKEITKNVNLNKKVFEVVK